MSEWTLIDNPGFAGKTPRPLTAACHDGTPFITVGCPNGCELHLHESQIEGVPDDGVIGVGCPTCGKVSMAPAGFFQGAFAKLREDGWLA